MPVTRNPNDFNHTTNWTPEINEIPNQSSFIKSMGLFTPNFTDQEAILFDKIESTVTLLPDSNRREGKPSYGKNRDVKTFSLPLAYMKHADNITKQDYLSKRKAGTANENDTLQNVIATKLIDGRRRVDQTHEYMMLQAAKGISVTPQGTTLANMFTEFGIAQPTVDFALQDATTNIDAKISELKNKVVSNLKTGGVISGTLDVVVGQDFFNAFVNHPKVIQAYLNSTSNARYQEEMARYFTWGISDVFVHRNVRFMVYGHTFNLPDGTTETAVENDEGHVLPSVMGESIFRAYYGPSQRLDSEGGAEMFAWEYRDPRQTSHEIEFETAPLFIATKPAALVKLITYDLP